MSVRFVCENIECPAPLAKKGKEYLMAMECPFCDVPLTQQTSFSVLEERLINSLPYLIAYPLRRAILEQHGQSKVTLLKDTFLNYLKYLGLLSASEFFASDIKNKNMVSLFQNTLTEPSFGKWNTYIRETLKFLKAKDHRFFIPELMEYYDLVESGEKRKLYKGNIEVQNLHGETQIKEQKATGIGMLINFRNRYLGHGQTLAKTEYLALWEEYSPIFFTLLEQLQFASKYEMYKNEHGSTVKLQTFDLMEVEHGSPLSSKVWLENPIGEKLDIVPFFVVPGELSIAKEDKEQLMAYEAYTGKTIKFFSPEGTEKQSSGRTLERLNMLLRDKQNENTFNAEAFTKEVFAERIREENKLLLDTLIAERKVMPGIYVHREDMEIRIREWIGARMSILFIAAEAGSGKTNLLVEAQRQYQERRLHSLLIRAGRMEKGTLMEQITYMLNLEKGKSLSDYPAIAGTQDAPTFILIDGLNEASHSEAIWLEILALAQMFYPGSLKFLVTSRANTSSDLDRYVLSSQEEDLLYRDDNKPGTDLKSAAFWLTALNMAEMKDAWQLYALKDKSRFKPLFSFDDIAGFDRGIYDEISNPLILRIFLEVYNGKQLASKGKKIINIWEDWLATFSSEEMVFMELLAKEIWESGVNELLLDDLLRNSNINKYLLSNVLNSPYNRLKNLGWLGRFTRNLNIYIVFTVEGLLFQLIAKHLKSLENSYSVKFYNDNFNSQSKIKNGGLIAFQYECIKDLNFEVLLKIIDSKESNLFHVVKPVIALLKLKGPREFLSLVLSNKSNNDFEIILLIQMELTNLGLLEIRGQLLDELMDSLSVKTLQERILFLFACENNPTRINICKVNSCKELAIQKNETNALIILTKLFLKCGAFNDAIDCANYLTKNANYYDEIKLNEVYLLLSSCYELISDNQSAKQYLEKFKSSLEADKFSIANQCDYLHRLAHIQIYAFDLIEAKHTIHLLDEIIVRNYGSKHPKTAEVFKLQGLLNQSLGNYDSSLEFYELALILDREIFGPFSVNFSDSLNNCGMSMVSLGKLDKALSFFEQSLDVNLKLFGGEHSLVASGYSDIGYTYFELLDFDEAENYFMKSLEVGKQILHNSHPNLAICCMDLGNVNFRKHNFNNSLKFYEESHRIFLRSYGVNHINFHLLNNNIGLVYLMLQEYDKCEHLLESVYLYFRDNYSEHNEMNSIKINLGLLFVALNKLERAHMLFGEAYQGLKINSIEHPDTLKALVNFTKTSYICSDMDCIESLMEEWERIAEYHVYHLFQYSGLEHRERQFNRLTREAFESIANENWSEPVLTFVVPVKHIRQ